LTAKISLTKEGWIHFSALLAILGIVYYLYQQGFSGGSFFDDLHNLGSLDKVRDFDSALGFIMNGSGGPLGRPLAYLSFILNAPSWPDSIGDILHTNTCIHLINGLLLIWLAYKLVRFFPEKIHSPEKLALTLGILWLAHPLLVSANLMAVQRMTTLSATFVLGGLLTFVTGLENIRTHARRAFWLMTLGISLGTALATLTKENGILLPLYALVIQATLLANVKPHASAWFIWWRRIFLILPVLALPVYFVFTWPQIIDGYAIRDFSPGERLLTQSRVLANYLYLIAVPLRSSLGPYHDDFIVSRGIFSPYSTFVALAFWLTAFIGAFIYRKKYPVASFGILWFLAGHNLESSVLSLENYFEHRNYLPAIGPLFAISYFFWRQNGRPGVWLKYALAAYIGLYLIVLHGATEVWGNRNLAAELWSRDHPASERAAQELSQRYFSLGKRQRAQEIIAHASQRDPQNIGLALQTLQTACGLGNEKAILEQLERPEADKILKQGKVSTLICGTMSNMAYMVIDKQCGQIAANDLQQIIDRVLPNPRLKGTPDINYCLHDLKSMLYYNERNLEMTMKHLELAFSHKKYLNTAVRMVEFPASAGLYDVAQENLESALRQKPKNPLIAKIWEKKLAEVKTKLDYFRNLNEQAKTSGKQKQ